MAIQWGMTKVSVGCAAAVPRGPLPRAVRGKVSALLSAAFAMAPRFDTSSDEAGPQTGKRRKPHHCQERVETIRV